MHKIAAGIVAGIAALGAVTAVTAFALDQSGTAPGTPGIPVIPGIHAAAPTGSAKEAEAVLTRSAAAYAAAGGLTDVMRLNLSLPDGSEEVVEIPYALGAGTDGRVDMPALRAVALGSSLFLVRDEVADKYAEIVLTGDIRTTLEAIFGGDASLPVAFDLRRGRGVASYVAGLGLGVLERPRLSGYDKVDDDTPHGSHRLWLAADNGRGTVHIDAGTNLLSALEIATDQLSDVEPGMVVRVKFSPKVHASPSGLITFDPGSRRKVRSFRELQPTPVAVGERAPDFTLETLDGERVTLSALRGSVVVLDFWATWCRPCIMALPLLDEFHDWAQSSGHPIAAYAIDTFESVPAERMKSQAAALWQSQKFSMPTLLDFDGAAVARYGIQSIPTTYIIDRDGVIAKVHQGFDANMATKLKTEVLELLD